MSQVVKQIFGNPNAPELKFAMYGLRGSGKTVALACLHHACVDYANSHMGMFWFRVDEKTSGIRDAPSKLREGHFPPATPPGTLFEADFIMRRKKGMGTQTIRLPFIETAGEEIAKLIERFGAGMYALDQNCMMNAQSIQENVLNVDGIGLIVPVDRALTFGDKGIDSEPESVSHDPDVNLARLVDTIYNYKERMQLPKPRGIAVFLTKSDKLMQALSLTGINLNTPDGIRSFMTTYFPETYSLLNFRADNMRNVRFWPVWVQLELDKNKKPLLHEDGTEKIMLDRTRKDRCAVFSRPAYEQFIPWLFQLIG